MSYPFDATLKDIVAEHPADFAAVFGLPTNVPVQSLNNDLSTISAATDVVLGFGNPPKEVADLNFQSGPDAKLPQRLLLYNAALHSKYETPVRSIVVLLRPKADGATLTGKLTYGSDPCRVEFGYAVIRLWNEPVESFLRGGLALLPLATLCQMPDDRPLPDALREVVREIARRLGLEASHAEAARLLRASIVLTVLRVHRSKVPAIYEGMVDMQEEMVAYDELLLEGEVRGKLGTLLRQGRKLIGAPDAETEAALRSINDVDKLDRLLDVVHSAKSWSELLATE